jgi:hypothetical protein
MLLFKFTTTFLAAWIAFVVIDHNPLNVILIISLVGAIIKYILGDLLLFPSIGNVLASVIDGVLAATTIYIIDIFTNVFVTSATGLNIFAVIIAIAEYFFHIYLLKNEEVTHNEFHREHPME